MLLVKHMLIDGIGHGIWFWHRNLNMLNNLDGIWFLDFNWIWFLHRIGNFAFRYFRHNLVDGHLNFLLYGHMNRIGFGYMQLYDIGYLYDGKYNINNICIYNKYSIFFT